MQAKNLILDLINMKSSGDQEIKRDASVALDNIVKKFGSENPNPSDFLSPDWKGDFKAIHKRVTIVSRTKNMNELKIIINRMNTIIFTNIEKTTRSNAIQVLIQIAEMESKLLDQYKQKYIDAILDEPESIQKQINELLRKLDPKEYSEDYEETINKLKSREKIIKINPKYDYENDFIRYIIQIINNTDEIIWDVQYKITKFEKNFIIREIKPESYEIFEENTILLSVIQPGDLKEIIAKIEPKSSQIYLEGILYYKKYNEQDISKIYTHTAENIIVDLFNEWPRLQDVTEKVSIVHCRELFDFHVKFKSMNAFALPHSITPEVVYSIGKRILSDLHFILVMDVVNQENFFGEALFYGKAISDLDALYKEDEIVVILRCSHENYALEINIGCNRNSYLVILQIKFDNLLRQVIMSREEITKNDKLIELRCPNCFQGYDRLNRDWCPWCGKDIELNKLIS